MMQQQQQQQQQQLRNSFTAPSPPEAPQPPPLNINNSEDLTLVLSAVKETQTNLRTLQPMLMQLGDPVAMEDIAKAFKITASSSQFVLASDLPSAYSALNEAWAKIKKLEDRLAEGQHNPQPQGMPVAFRGPGVMMGRHPMGELPQSVMQSELAGGPLQQPPPNSNNAAFTNKSPISDAQIAALLASNNSYVPVDKMKRKAKEKTKQKSPTSPKSGPKAKVASLKSSLKAKFKKANSREPSPSKVRVTELKDLPVQNRDDPDVIMKRLQGLMERTQNSQKQLQVSEGGVHLFCSCQWNFWPVHL